MKNGILFILACLLLTGCKIDESPSPFPGSSESQSHSDIDSIAIDDFFPLENKIYSFNGEGNEYAAYKETFFTRIDHYLPSIVENGGTRILKVYELTTEGIYLVYEQPEYYEETLPSIDSIKGKFNRQTLLMSPLTIGTVYDDWEIVNIDEEIQLPIGKIKKIIVVEQKDEENQTIITSFWAPGYGKIKEEFVSTEGSEEFKVVSELKNME
ncbi:hypothetical protein J2Z40_000847 [Cytobacillus eiseniae]|uniref:Lipoprotein n=1 Tax=Cytobacillus eiseniae TaxID=762947 RepID=A0ABS4RBL3_9BACI|nr:hypothetical protein [Cytobacillus eiseniae]MBP2240294.1 hypothetical protein [Cytobacillus eiseniae]